jgi:hypothetical protein
MTALPVIKNGPSELTFPVLCDPVTLRRHSVSRDPRRRDIMLTTRCHSDVTVSSPGEYVD